MRNKFTKLRGEHLKCRGYLHKFCLLFATLAFAHGTELNLSAQSVARVYSAGQRLLEQVAPDSLAFADVDIGPVNIPLTHAQRDARTGEFPTKFMGYQVLVSNRLMQITSIQGAPEPPGLFSENIRHTDGLLRLGIYIPSDVPLSGEVILGQPGARVEIRRDDAQGNSQTIGIGQTTVLSTSPQFFINRSSIYGGIILSVNDVTGMAGQLSGEDYDGVYREYEYRHTIHTPNLATSQPETTRVILFGTGFRNAPNSDLTNDPAGFKNVAEAYRCKTYLTFRNDISFVLSVTIEYVGPVKEGMPGVDQIIILLRPEMIDANVDIWAWEDKTNRDTNVNNVGNIRGSIPVE